MIVSLWCYIAEVRKLPSELNNVCVSITTQFLMKVWSAINIWLPPPPTQTHLWWPHQCPFWSAGSGVARCCSNRVGVSFYRSLPGGVVLVSFTVFIMILLRKREVVCLFVLLLYVPSQQLWSWRDGQFTKPHFFLGKLEQALNQYSVHILSLVTDNIPSLMIQRKGGEWP